MALGDCGLSPEEAGEGENMGLDPVVWYAEMARDWVLSVAMNSGV